MRKDRIRQLWVTTDYMEKLREDEYAVRLSHSRYHCSRVVDCDEPFTLRYVALGRYIAPSAEQQRVWLQGQGFGLPLKTRTRYTFSPEEGGGTLTFDRHVPCRKCLQCRKTRISQCKRMMVDEISHTAARLESTWMCTLTLNPDSRRKMWTAAHREGCPTDPNLSGRTEWLWRECLLFLARVRYRVKTRINGKIRYSGVVEYHKDGTEHLHLLVHGPIRKWQLEAAGWHLGFAKFKKVNNVRAASYISKYLFKEERNAFFRHSQKYGGLYVEPHVQTERSERECQPETSSAS